MNKRIHKKKMKFVIDNIQQVKLREGEFLVFRFDPNKQSPQNIEYFANRVKENVSSKILFVPTDMQMIKASEV